MDAHIENVEARSARPPIPISTGNLSRSFALRVGAAVAAHPGYSRSISDPSGDSKSLSPPHRYRDGMTIRAVTPEPEPEFANVDLDVGDNGAVSSRLANTPPRTPSRTAGAGGRRDAATSPEPPVSPDNARKLATRTAAQHLEDLTITRTKSRSPVDTMRNSRSMVADDQRFDVGPPTPGGGSSSVTRQRYAPPQQQPPGSETRPPISVGYPSTQAMQSPRPHTGKPGTRHRLLRTSASINTLQPEYQAKGPVDILPPKSPVNADFESLVQLMKRLRGKMDGYLEFRRTEVKIWTKGYCQIDMELGALTFQQDDTFTSSHATHIVPDLRGCQVKPSSEDGIIELSTHLKDIELRIRPLSAFEYSSWLAALLCWSPLRPIGTVNNKLAAKSQSAVVKDKRRRNSDATFHNRGETNNIIKAGKMLLWKQGASVTGGIKWAETEELIVLLPSEYTDISRVIRSPNIGERRFAGC